MNETQRHEFLAQANVAVLASVGPGGGAHAAPIWYVFEDGVFVMSTSRGSQKHRNLERNPDVTLVIDRRTVPYYAVMAQGTVELGPPLDADSRLRMAVRYLGDDLGRKYVERVKGEDSVSIRLRPRRLIEYEGRARRTVR